MRGTSRTKSLAAILLIATTVGACSHEIKRTLTPPKDAATLDKDSPYLKAHMRDGNVYILSHWSVDEAARTVSGTGELWSAARQQIKIGRFDLSIDAVALFETNVKQTSPAVSALAVITGISVAITAACIANPKSCFGSCPTFYVSDGDHSVLQAEGFSASVAPSLEALDVDALYQARAGSDSVEIRVTNEALETHVIRYVDLIAVERPASGRVFVDSSGKYRRAAKLHEPATCNDSRGGDCLADVRAFDHAMRSSTTDAKDLATREFIELTFPPQSSGKLGIVIGARQTFLSTYLFYQALAYMGRSTGYYIAALERGDPALLEKIKGIHHVLGGVEVQIRNENNDWTTVGAYEETGPLATDVQIIPLPDSAHAQQVRLRLTRGHWRLDYIALAELTDGAEPLRMQPSRALSTKTAEDVRARLVNLDQTLTTGPGDEYVLHYELPTAIKQDPTRYELFLESRGYYLEWMRDEWIREESSLSAAMMFSNPAAALRVLAPAFKKIEANMEELFWKSRYANP